MALTEYTATFHLEGDKFEHAWFFNRFRCDAIGQSILVTTALITESGGSVPVVNGFVLSKSDLRGNRERSLSYLTQLSQEITLPEDMKPLLLASPDRVYPVNHINLSRMDEVAEIGLYRYSIHTLLLKTKTSSKGSPEKSPAKADSVIPCYPVVMFRCDLSVQLSLIKELYSHEF